jgi:glycosyltransferase involved in cell wall biosynthesis
VIERHVLRRAAHVFVVSDESRDRAIERGADPRRISIVGNTPEDPAQLAQPAPVPTELAGLEDRPVLLFTGILIFDRGVQHTVRAIERVRQHVPDVAFVIVGDGPDAPMIRAEVERLGLQDHVRMTGWVEHARLTGFYQNADVGLLPFLNGGQIRFTLANKLFDYMGAGLPVLASDVPPMRRIVRETGAGELAPAGDPDGLAQALVRMLRRPAAERTDMGRRGAEAVATTYNWAADARRLVAAVDAVNRSP